MFLLRNKTFLSNSFFINSYKSIGTCCVQNYFNETEHGDKAFSVRTIDLRYGKVLEEVGDTTMSLINNKLQSRVALFTDKNVKNTKHFELVLHSLKKQNLNINIFDNVHIEPTDYSFKQAADWCKDINPEIYISLGGGSVMDTTKAAMLYSSFPPPNDDFFYYVNKPVGQGNKVPKTLPPHIAIPTTAGTGSECTGFAICKITDHPTAALSKTGIASEKLCPTVAMVDPRVIVSLPSTVVAASGFDVLCHAIESYTARPFTERPVIQPQHQRPLNQGANPYSDFACVEALRICGEYFERALSDDSDMEAREKMLWASTIVGTAMGNAGVAVPHGLSYPVCGHIKNFTPDSGYPKDNALLPHGMGVSLCAPAAVRITASGCPERHLNCSQLLQSEYSKDGSLNDAGEILANEIIRLLKIAKFPNGIEVLGYNDSDLSSLTNACYQQKRVIDNAPITLEKEHIETMYKDSKVLW